ncbi:MAG: hypothetical protein IPK22_16685 [Verrucomicrobiaceae bacterium]|nr:hypothetical protein [Verrucomicrobiaceae bacterium]
MENQIKIAHQDGDIVLPLKKGGYFYEDRGFGISIEAEAASEEDWEKHPNCASLASFGHPVTNPLAVGQVFGAKGGMGYDCDATPNAGAYFGFHAEQVSISWRIISIEGDRITVELEAFTEDVDYYDDRAKPQPISGVFSLQRCEPSELWVPY